MEILTILFLLLNLAALGVLIYLAVLLIKALKKYLASNQSNTGK